MLSYSKMECAVWWKAAQFHCVQLNDKGLLISMKIVCKERKLKFGRFVCLSVGVEICVITKFNCCNLYQQEFCHRYTAYVLLHHF